MTPITKNIRVVDENGNEYEATYPKRAAGLVRHGRARFTAPDTICLACPPNIELNENTEDIKMSENTVNNVIEQIVEETAAEKKAAAVPITLPDLLERIDRIAAQTDYLMKALEQLQAIPPAAGPGDIVGQAKAQAVADIVRCRETTNQRILQMYETMYADLKPSDPVNSRLAALELIKGMLVHTKDDPDFWDTLRHTLSLFDQ
jgi:hypothetical protein